MSWVKGDGAKIKLTFTQPLVGDVTGQQGQFTVTVPEYTFVPDGTIQNVVKSVLSTYAGDTAKELILEMQPLQRFESAAGDITIAYSGAGSLMGIGGPVAAFTKSFTPVELVPKPDQREAEHIELSGLTITGTLTKINYVNAQNGGEHLEVSGISTVGILTHVNDL